MLGAGGMLVLGLLVLFPLTALVKLLKEVMLDYRGREFRETFELKDGVIKKRSLE
jgi:hypothetical protein